MTDDTGSSEDGGGASGDQLDAEESADEQASEGSGDDDEPIEDEPDDAGGDSFGDEIVALEDPDGADNDADPDSAGTTDDAAAGADTAAGDAGAAVGGTQPLFLELTGTPNDDFIDLTTVPVWPGTTGFNLLALAGKDTVIGLAVEDIIDGGGGADSILANAGDDTVSGGAGKDTIRGGEGRDEIHGGAGADSLDGGDDADTIAGGTDDDTVTGGKGRDDIEGGEGDDSLVGGDGHDTLSGGAGADTLTGNAGGDSLVGGDGDDFIDGGSGADTLDGGSGNNQLMGGDGPDVFTWGAFTPGDINAIFDFDPGTDRIDLRRLNLSTAQVQVVEPIVPVLGGLLSSSRTISIDSDGDGEFDDLTIQVFVASGLANAIDPLDVGIYPLASGIDVLVSTETSSGGGDDSTTGSGGGDDSTTGSGGGDDTTTGSGGCTDTTTIVGTAGNDRLTGSDCNEILIGGLGKDTLQGGGGNDIFTLNAVEESSREFGFDYIYGFDAPGRAAGDLIDLSAIDADLLTPGHQAFTYAGPDASPGQGVVIWFDHSWNDSTMVQGQQRGGGWFQFWIFDGAAVSAADYTQDDFVIAGGRSASSAGGGDSTTGSAGGDDTTTGSGGGDDSTTGSGGGDDTTTGSGGGDDSTTGSGGGDDSTTGSGGGDDSTTGSGGCTDTTTIVGTAGNDRLTGSDCNEILIGGLGKDTLQGGGGNDIFTLNAVEESSREFGFDYIYGFDAPGRAAGDLIDLSAIDADLLTPGHQAFTYAGPDASPGQGVVIWFDHSWNDSTMVQGQQRGGGWFQFWIFDGAAVSAADYTQDDFVL